MTRLASLPDRRELLPAEELRKQEALARKTVLVPDEIAGIRRRLSLMAARLTPERARVEATIIAVERELARLRRLKGDDNADR